MNGQGITKTRVGVALGGGSAKGWAHIGVLRRLEARGLAPDVVCGTSIGALVGAAYAAGRLDDLESWVRTLTRRDVLRFLDVSLAGGLFAAKRLFDFFAEQFEDVRIEDLERPYAAVACDLRTGQEVWLRQGSVLDAVRASIALPGLFTPRRAGERWLVDGGLVNPVPVSVCRALGADRVVAVDLQSQAAPWPQRESGETQATPAVAREASTESAEDEGWFAGWLWRWVRETTSGEPRAGEPRAGAGEGEGEDEAPSIFEVISGAVEIMQVRISRSRLAGDPPDLLVAPQLPEVGVLDYYLAEGTIAEGERAFERAWAAAAAEPPPPPPMAED